MAEMETLIQWDGPLGPDEIFKLYENDELLISTGKNEHRRVYPEGSQGDYTYYVTKYHTLSGLESDPSNVVVHTIKKPTAPTNLRLTWVKSNG